jgi:hypothetical protein
VKTWPKCEYSHHTQPRSLSGGLKLRNLMLATRFGSDAPDTGLRRAPLIRVILLFDKPAFSSRRQLTPILDKPAFSRIPWNLEPRTVVEMFGEFVKRQVCPKWG